MRTSMLPSCFLCTTRHTRHARPQVRSRVVARARRKQCGSRTYGTSAKTCLTSGRRVTRTSRAVGQARLHPRQKSWSRGNNLFAVLARPRVMSVSIYRCLRVPWSFYNPSCTVEYRPRRRVEVGCARRSEGRARSSACSRRVSLCSRLSSMPTCLASGSGLLRTAVHPRSSDLRRHAICASRKVAGRRRDCGVRRVALSTVTAAHSSSYEEQRAHTLTVLHKTSALLPRILPTSRPGPSGVPLRASLRFWEDVLGKVHEDLSLSPEKEKGRVRIVGE